MASALASSVPDPSSIHASMKVFLPSVLTNLVTTRTVPGVAIGRRKLVLWYAVAGSGAPVDLPEPTDRRDGSGVPTAAPVEACAGPAASQIGVATGVRG